jgi:hypothetical protein
MAQSQWPTPEASDVRKHSEVPATVLRRISKGQQIALNAFVSLTVSEKSTWPTPMAGTPAQNGNSAAGNNDGIRKMEMILGMRETINGPKVSGPITNGSPATTEKRAVFRGVPNPTFAMWLMGFPENLRNAILRVCSSLPSRGGNKPGRSRETP